MSKKEDKFKVSITRSIYLEEVSEGQFVLKRYGRKRDKNGNLTYTVLGYYNNLEQPIRKIFTMKVLNESRAKDLAELSKDVKRINNEIREMLGIRSGV